MTSLAVAPAAPATPAAAAAAAATPTAAAPTAAAPTKCQRLKAEGNAAFVAGKYGTAERLYSGALAAAEDAAAAPADAADRHKIYGNRSAARNSLDNYEDALTDALRALEICPTWVKGYHRKAVALIALGKMDDGVAAYEEAVKLDPENSGLQQKLARAQKRARDHAKRSRIRGLSHWLNIFGSQQNVRLRLGVMAYFWNEASQPERLLIFRRFLGLIGLEHDDDAMGRTGFTEDRMTELPLDNYSDLDIPGHWLSYFGALESSDKGKYFEEMFKALSEQEKTLVVNDLKYFFGAPGGN
jgi:tetratricopeptide (TPR) repeat protein